MRSLMNILARCAMPIVTSAILMSACSSDESNNETPKSVEKSNVQGTIEKGPFVQGSKVMLYELDANFGQTGKSFRTQTVSDLGAFSFDSPIQLSSQYVELETSGYFYNEVKGKLSASQITLNAISDVSNRNTVNVNLITHLEFERVKRLIREGKNFSTRHKVLISTPIWQKHNVCMHSSTTTWQCCGGMFLSFLFIICRITTRRYLSLTNAQYWNPFLQKWKNA